MKLNHLVILAILSGVVGCAKEEAKVVADFKGDFLELVPRYTNEVEVGEAKTIAEMKDSDAIVVVNGYPLTKANFDDLMVIRTKRLLKRKGASPAAVESLVNQFKRQYVPQFVFQRLMLDKARELKVLESAEVEKQVNDELSAVAKQRKTTVDKIVKSFPGDFKYYLYDAAAEKWMDKLVEKHIPPKMIVDDAFVSNCQAQVELDNAATTATNQLFKARMLEWKQSVLAGKVSFDELAEKFSQDSAPEGEKPSYWGEFERGCIEDKNLQAQVFAMPVGEISDPIEDEEGFHLVKVLKATPPVKNDKGRMIQDEVRVLAHVFIEKLPLLLRQDDEAMFADLQEQMKMQAIIDYGENLRTNSTYKVVYPHGEKLF